MSDTVAPRAVIVANEDKSWVERTAAQLGRLAYDATHEFGVKGGGVIKWGTKGIDKALDTLGVEPDSIVRRQIVRDLKSLDEYGAFGVQILPEDPPWAIAEKLLPFVRAYEAAHGDTARVQVVDP